MIRRGIFPAYDNNSHPLIASPSALSGRGLREMMGWRKKQNQRRILPWLSFL